MKHSAFLILLFLTSCGKLDVTMIENLNPKKQDQKVTASLEQKSEQASEQALEHMNSEQSLADPNSPDLDVTDPHLDTKPVEGPQIKAVVKNTEKVKEYCKKLDKNFLNWGWGEAKCNSHQWHHVRNSFLGDPLIWKVYGDEQAHQIKSKNTTMIFCGVHGDEITPIKFCFDVMKFLDQQSPKQFEDKLVVVAPIVNPDSYFKKYPSRTNYRGIDVNRNFPTKDWSKKAIKLWKTRYRKDKRRFPGKKPLSEQETIFQVNLIKRYAPDKIISVHAPLTILDYDGPVVQHKVAKHAKALLTNMSKQAKGYKIKNYPFFPGSLGNYAGNERGIPTYTLELPSSDNRKHKVYWRLFKESIHAAIFHDFRKEPQVANSAKLKKAEDKTNL